MFLATSGTWDPNEVGVKAPFREVEQADRAKEENAVNGEILKRIVQQALEVC